MKDIDYFHFMPSDFKFGHMSVENSLHPTLEETPPKAHVHHFLTNNQALTIGPVSLDTMQWIKEVIKECRAGCCLVTFIES